MTVGHFCCGIDIEIDGCDMRRPIFAPMFTIMAIFGWAHTGGQLDMALNVRLRHFFEDF